MQLPVGELVADRVRNPDGDRRLADAGRARKHDHGGRVAFRALPHQGDDLADHVVAAGEVRQVERQLADRGDVGGTRREHALRHQRRAQLAQPGAGLGAELFVQHPLGRLVRLDGVRGPAGGAQRDDQLRPELFAQRVFGDQPAQLGDGFTAAAEVDPRPQALFLHRQPEFGEPGDGRAPAVVVRQPFEDFAAPQRVGPVEELESALGVAAIERFLRFAGRSGEGEVVQFVGRRGQQVAGGPAADPLAEGGVDLGEPPSQGMDVRADVRRGRARRRFRPQHFHQHVGRHDDVRLQRQRGQQQPGLRPAQPDHLPAGGDLQRTEDADGKRGGLNLPDEFPHARMLFPTHLGG